MTGIKKGRLRTSFFYACFFVPSNAGMQAAKIRACPARRKAHACRHSCRRGGAPCPFASWRWAQGAPAVSAGDRQRGCALALLPGRVVLQQDSRISETADPGAQFRFAAGGQGQDKATIFAVLDLLVGGPDALPYIVGGIGDTRIWKVRGSCQGRPKPPCSSSSRL